MNPEGKIIGVKIYDTEREYSSLVDEWGDLGINTAFVSEHLLSDRFFRDAARNNEVRLFVILPIFYDKNALNNDPELFAITNQGERAEDEWVKFVCPSRDSFIKEKIEHIINLIREFDPEGISLDFIRHFVFWEKIYPGTRLDSIPSACFDDTCVASFQEALNIEIPDMGGSITQVSDWILKNCIDKWVNWKCELITKTVRKISERVRADFPECLINLHAVPWRESDYGGAIKKVAGQDFSSLSEYVDMISPMCYAHMLMREPDWISSVVSDISSQSNSKVIPSIQVKEHYLSERLTINEFRRSISEAVQPPSGGVIYWSWEALEKEPEKVDVIRTSL